MTTPSLFTIDGDLGRDLVTLPEPDLGPGVRYQGGRIGPNRDAEGRSAGQRLVARQRADIANGRHPLARGPVDPDPSRTCGNCLHRARVSGYDHAKCDQPTAPRSRAATTDVRASWPACSGGWEPKP